MPRWVRYRPACGLHSLLYRTVQEEQEEVVYRLLPPLRGEDGEDKRRHEGILKHLARDFQRNKPEVSRVPVTFLRHNFVTFLPTTCALVKRLLLGHTVCYIALSFRLWPVAVSARACMSGWVPASHGGPMKGS